METSLPRSVFERELVVRSDPQECWRTITDVPQLVSWVSVLEDASEISPLQSYRAVLQDRLGPFRLRADLDIVLSDVREGEHLHVRAEGEDRQVGSRISVNADLDVIPAAEGGGARVRIVGEYEVAGRVAGMGGPTIHKKANRILDEFFVNAGASLGAA
jgi:carbon monoxide dehydrogenase subunit G